MSDHADEVAPESPPSRGPGRPRTWASNADRARAYRQRKASEHAAVDELRRDRRNLRRQVARLTQALDQERRHRQAAEQRATRLATDLESLQRRLDRLVASASTPRQLADVEPHRQPAAPNRAARRRAAKPRRRP